MTTEKDILDVLNNRHPEQRKAARRLMDEEPPTTAERDKVAELLHIVDVCKGFGTVVITFAGSRFACSIDDLREAIQRRTQQKEETPCSDQSDQRS